ncbi:phosphatidate cytidylyltransferase [Streptococcus salivarius CAG:79]|nr:phosphatidate cytidylyltransferase [Streptococcus salivarius CAG:79]
MTGFAVISFLILAGTVLNSDHYSFDDAAYPIASAFYVGFGFQNLIAARMDSWEKVLFALFIVWATDIGAYLFGRQFGQNKLLSKVSPNKTIEGSVGGILSAIIVALIFGLINHGVYAPHSFFWLLICTILFSIFGQFGDLVESAIKRHFGVKDSGNLIPGHGGILDRCDSWIFVFPIMHFLGLF